VRGSKENHVVHLSSLTTISKPLFLYLSIYIKKKVCVFVIYAFGHDTSKCNETLQGILFRPGEGRKVVSNPKFSPQGGGVFAPYCWIYYSKCLFQRICARDCFLNNSKTKEYKNLRFLPLGTRYFRIFEKNE
jgi:hypothetical protein